MSYLLKYILEINYKELMNMNCVHDDYYLVKVHVYSFHIMKKLQTQ